MTFSRSIRALRLSKGWTQAHLAKQAGLAQPNLAAFESGARRPNWASVARLAQGLGVSPSELLAGFEPVKLDRFEMDRLAKGLIQGSVKPPFVSEALWRDLLAIFATKLAVLAPNPERPVPRLSPYAAERRVKALLSAAVLDELCTRVDKRYPVSVT